MDTAEILVLLLASVAALALLAQRLTIPYPILLVLGGLAIGFLPGLPSVRLSPELVLLIFLPPLLFVFLLIGLQLPTIWANLSYYSVPILFWYAIATCLVVILVRPIWVFPGAYLPRWLSRRIRQTEPDPAWRNVLVVPWSGMRGVVSLAAALALPATTSSGERFPDGTCSCS